MHPNPLFRSTDEAFAADLVAQTGFGMVFLTTPDGPRVAHVPLLWRGGGKLAFHLARGNALTRHLDGATALVVVNGPDGYVSPRWYDDAATVPTWNYVAIEGEGVVRRTDRDALLAIVTDLSDRHEGLLVDRIGGEPWTMDKVPDTVAARLLDAIVGFTIDVAQWRTTAKLSQNKPAADRARVARAFHDAGNVALAARMKAD